ncbi:uncharacterized protein METZ01_LOCUS285957, partial [marine metagenome]
VRVVAIQKNDTETVSSNRLGMFVLSIGTVSIKIYQNSFVVKSL